MCFAILCASLSTIELRVAHLCMGRLHILHQLDIQIASVGGYGVN